MSEMLLALAAETLGAALVMLMLAGLRRMASSLGAA